MKKKLIVLSSVALGLVPVSVFAQGQQAFDATCSDFSKSGSLGYLICKFGDILNSLIPLIVILGIVYFVWGVISYVIGDDEEAKSKGRNRMIYGIIGLAVIVAMWGLVNILIRTFDLKNTTTHSTPTVNFNPQAES